MKRRAWLVTSFLIVLLGCVVETTATAQAITDNFSGTIDTLNNTVSGTGSGYDNGTFFEYPQPDGPTWWNQWFFNNEEIVGWKDIFYDLTLTPAFGPIQDDQTFVSPEIEVAINWSNTDWLEPSMPPINGEQFDAEPFIERESVFLGTFDLVPNSQQTWDAVPITIANPGDPLLIEDYNPIWVSIDIRTTQPGGESLDGETLLAQDLPVDFNGTIEHEHHPVPEPSLMLASLGLIGFLSCRRRRRA